MSINIYGIAGLVYGYYKKGRYLWCYSCYVNYMSIYLPIFFLMRPPVQAQGTVHISNHSRTQYNYYTENPKKQITYLIAILTPEEAKKAQSKQAPVSTSLELWSDEPWDTVKAQFLVKISDALSPQNLDFTD